MPDEWQTSVLAQIIMRKATRAIVMHTGELSCYFSFYSCNMIIAQNKLN